MALDLAEIVKLLSLVDRLAAETSSIFNSLKEHFAKEQDEKKRKKLLAACARRDVVAIRALLWD
jgi:hypothetical protein